MMTGNKTTRLFWILIILVLIGPMTLVRAQEVKPKMGQQKLTFTLFDQNGQQLTAETLKANNIKVYSTRETTAAFYPKITFDAETNYFTFSEPVISPGIALAFVSPVHTMFISIHGRFGIDRTIEGITLQNGSYMLTSNDFGNKTHLKVTDWKKYLEDDIAPEKQDLSSYKSALKGRSPVPVSVAVKTE